MIQRLLVLLTTLVVAGCALDPPSGTSVTLDNGTVWTDTSGAVLQSHDAVVQWGSRFYWYGLDYSQGQFQAINCYSSSDLKNWTLENRVLVATSDPELTYATVTNVRAARNPQTGRWVLWFTFQTPIATLARVMVASCDTPIGNFRVVSASFQPGLRATGAVDVLIDNDGRGYLMAQQTKKNDTTFAYIYPLSSDLTAMGTEISSLFPGVWFERLSLFRQGKEYHFIGVDGANVTYHAWSEDLRTWSDLEVLSNLGTVPAQFSSVLAVKGLQTTSWIVLLNHWNGANLGLSGYRWLPLVLSGRKASVSNYDNLVVNAVTGELSGRND